MTLGLRKIFHYVRRQADYIRKTNQIGSDMVSINAVKGDHIQIMSGSLVDSFCSIDSYTYIGFNCSLTNASIGRYCSIANNVTIGPGEHDLRQVSTSSLFYASQAELVKKQCKVCPDVWIGVDTIIRQGVEIGIGAALGANSFVNEDVPPFAVAVGSPARVIKYRFTKPERDLILESRWWEHDLPQAKAVIIALQKQLQGKS